MKTAPEILAEIDRLRICYLDASKITQEESMFAFDALSDLKKFILAPDDCEHVFFSDHNQTFKVVCKKCGVIQ